MMSEQKAKNIGDGLTDASYWDTSYLTRTLESFREDNWRDFVSLQLLRELMALNLHAKSVCEVGGGDAQMLAHLAKRHPSAQFAVVDYSLEGCNLARRRADVEGVDLQIYREDVFFPTGKLVRAFDVVFSLGVVEHFSDLPAILSAKSRLTKADGTIMTVIPNFASPIYAFLCKRWSRSVFENHIPHDVNSFAAGHKQAGLLPVAVRYVGSVEFGMLSMAMVGPEPKSWLDRKAFLWLTRLSKLIHCFEYFICVLPTTRLFSPFILIESRKLVDSGR
jgi:2-polyprenyl-3-methyl-5-hydroxy-6-metoxy-1,4-benzoquinol methylase